MKRELLRNFGKFLGVYLLTAIGALALLTSCDRLRHRPDNYDVANDSIKIAEAVDAVTNPQFISVMDIVEYRENHNTQLEIDSVFFSLPASTIQNVASVLFKKNKTFITKKDIVEEFKRCRSVYENLPEQVTRTVSKDSSAVDKTATDLGQRKTTKTTKDTVINGKAMKLIVETTETLE
jgi:hypothetical protein